MREEDIQLILNNNKAKGRTYDYWGLDMDTNMHTSTAYNIELLRYFGIDDIISSNIRSLKGMVFLNLEKGISKEFEGWSTAKIIKDLLENQADYRKKILFNGALDNESRKISRDDRYRVLQRQGWTCNQCGCKLKYSNSNPWSGEIAHIDHIHPYSKRATYSRGADNINELSNLQALCPKCNKEKSSKEVH